MKMKKTISRNTHTHTQKSFPSEKLRRSGESIHHYNELLKK